MNTGEAARRAGVRPATLRRWAREGLIPQYNGSWTPAAVGHARVVARMRERGHSLREIRQATDEGRLAFGYVDLLFAPSEASYTLARAARETGLEPALIERITTALGISASQVDSMTEEDVQLLRYAAAVLSAGFPVVAMLQLVQHFVEQDVVGHMEADLDDGAVDLGRMRVALAFADLAGYTRLTEEEGELQALDAVERFVEAVETTLPDEARVIKTIGDEVMIVGSDPAAIVDWAVGFQSLQSERPLPRIGIHLGVALYRDGDYFGRDVNIASRVAARSAGGEVLVTRPVVEHAGSHLEFERIAEVKLKGFKEPTEIFIARLGGEEE